MDELELLAIDFGDSKSGVARMNTKVGIPEPLPVLRSMGVELTSKIAEIAKQQGSQLVLVGLPTNLHSGADSEQTEKVRAFASELAKLPDLTVDLVDEALSTIDSQKWQERYPEASEDSLAACVILERYMNEKRAAR
jgi:putative holliday junction resolvase